MSVLMVDIGGSNVKLRVDPQGEMRKFPSGKKMTPQRLACGILALLEGWTVDQISIGFPGLVRNGRPYREPLNLGKGWLKFDYEGALRRPVRFLNDAAMQALGNYKDGRLFFLGLGTSTGACLIADDVIVPLEIGLIPLDRRGNFCERLSDEALERHGRKRWTASVLKAIALLRNVFRPDVLVVGGGNAKLIDPLPSHCRRVENSSAYLGARRLWEDADMTATPFETTWRLTRNSRLPDRP